MSKHCYFPSPKDDERRRSALNEAKKRGEVANEWLKTHTLTPDNLKDFQSIMKETDRNTRKK